MSARAVTPETCPVCGVDVRRGAKACPGCGADERSGWNEEDTRYDGLDLPEGAFTDGDEAPVRKQRAGALWLVVAVGLLALLILGIFLR